MSLPSVLVCFAVREEARFFRAPRGVRSDVLLTGIGPRNARRTLERALAGTPPGLVLSCGYAGGLDPTLEPGAVVFEAEPASGLAEALRPLGARPARFHAADRVIVTETEKQALRQATGADAVEMESAVIRSLCRTRGIPVATIRVISDTALEDLPLDFNRLAGADDNLSYAKLGLALVRSPGRVQALLRFRKRLKMASQRLAAVLIALLEARGG